MQNVGFLMTRLKYLNIYLGTNFLFELEFTQEECIVYSQLSAFDTDQQFFLKLLLEVVSTKSLSMFLQALQSALDHIIHINDPCHEYLVGLGR